MKIFGTKTVRNARAAGDSQITIVVNLIHAINNKRENEPN
jgi:hypothetical protein